jgi:hypothetical protein
MDGRNEEEYMGKVRKGKYRQLKNEWVDGCEGKIYSVGTDKWRDG